MRLLLKKFPLVSTFMIISSVGKNTYYIWMFVSTMLKYCRKD